MFNLMNLINYLTIQNNEDYQSLKIWKFFGKYQNLYTYLFFKLFFYYSNIEDTLSD